MTLTLDMIREAYRKVEKLPKLRGSKWICPGNAYRIRYENPLTKKQEEVIFMNDEELDVLWEEMAL